MKAFFVLLLLIASTAAADNADARLFGLWHVTDPVYSDEELTVKLDVSFDLQDATITAYCLYPRHVRLQVSVTSKVRYTSRVIRPLENKEQTKKGPNGYECTVAIQPIDIYYNISSAKTMVISDATGFQKFSLHKD
jgi:hypothetical protein